MSDAISAASLLMAVVAILYGAWYQEIIKAINVVIPKHDRAIPLVTVNQALLSRCVPLTFMAIAVSLVFLPDAFEILKHSFSVAEQMGFGAYAKYSSVRTAFCLVVFVSCAITTHLLMLLKSLLKVRRELMRS